MSNDEFLENNKQVLGVEDLLDSWCGLVSMKERKRLPYELL